VDINKRYKQIIWSLKPAALPKRSRKDLNVRGLCRQGAIRTRLWNRIDW